MIIFSKQRNIVIEQILPLYESNGWSSAQKPQSLCQALLNSHALVSAWDGENLVGIGNAISDGFLVVYYPHLLVHSDYQGQGIGKRIMEILKQRYEGMHMQMLVADSQAIDQLFNINVKGVFFLTQKLLPLLKDGGRIVNLSTGLTRITLPNYSVYASAKGAIEVLTRYIAKELGHRQIAVNAVAPGAIETDFGGGAVRDNPEVNQFFASLTALGRVGLPDDIGGAVALLLSEENRWITGQRIEISGGQSL